MAVVESVSPRRCSGEGQRGSSGESGQAPIGGKLQSLGSTNPAKNLSLIPSHRQT